MANKMRIVIDPEVCSGRPIVAGTRMRVADVLGLLAAGETEADILAEFEFLTAEDICACLTYAADELDHRTIRLAA